MRRLALAFVLLGLVACKDKGKDMSAAAKTDVQRLVTLSEKDVGEIEKGLPQGAEKMKASLSKEKEEPQQGSATVRSTLLRMRQQIPELSVAKSTFFAFTDPKGIAIRNDLEQDTMAGKDLLVPYPELKKVIDGAGYLSTQGTSPGAPNPAGPDKEWVAAVPVKKDDGSLSGLLVTGWTYRRFAYHLQEQLKRDLQDELMRSGDKGKLPIVYVFLFDKDAVYGTRETPPINEKTLGEQNLESKTDAGPTEGTLTITDRVFGYAAARAPKLGPGVGIAVLRSDI